MSNLMSLYDDQILFTNLVSILLQIFQFCFSNSYDVPLFFFPTMTIASPRKDTWLVRPDPRPPDRKYSLLGSWSFSLLCWFCHLVKLNDVTKNAESLKVESLFEEVGEVIFQLSWASSKERSSFFNYQQVAFPSNEGQWRKRQRLP